jgi:hypothetical protein
MNAIEYEVLPSRLPPFGNSFVQAFHTRHGERPVLIETWFLYESGARREQNAMGALIEPPTNNYERLNIQIRFWKRLVDDAEKTFDQEKGTLMMMGNARARNSLIPLPVSGEAVQRLKALKDWVQARRERLAQAQAALAQTPEFKQREAWQQSEAEDRQRGMDFVQTIKAIEI